MTSNCIAVDEQAQANPPRRPHHVVVWGNTVTDCPLVGITVAVVLLAGQSNVVGRGCACAVPGRRAGGDAGRTTPGGRGPGSGGRR
ncbi:hypothetical protein ACFOW4_18625 [Micromonospora sp. GCM10011542]|uniref:hypothetical protein n=1 Tax=Micromonospora sp. GCM10011542 TaxID=3317337 RepID=UPI0036101CD3